MTDLESRKKDAGANIFTSEGGGTCDTCFAPIDTSVFIEGEIAALQLCPDVCAPRVLEVLQQITGDNPTNDADLCDDCGANTNDDGMSCPDGAYICRPCFDKGNH